MPLNTLSQALMTAKSKDHATTLCLFFWGYVRDLLGAPDVLELPKIAVALPFRNLERGYESRWQGGYEVCHGLGQLPWKLALVAQVAAKATQIVYV